MTEPTVPPPRFERLAHVDRRADEILARPANQRPYLIFVTDHPADGALRAGARRQEEAARRDRHTPVSQAQRPPEEDR